MVDCRRVYVLAFFYYLFPTVWTIWISEVWTCHGLRMIGQLGVFTQHLAETTNAIRDLLITTTEHGYLGSKGVLRSWICTMQPERRHCRCIIIRRWSSTLENNHNNYDELRPVSCYASRAKLDLERHTACPYRKGSTDDIMDTREILY